MIARFIHWLLYGPKYRSLYETWPKSKQLYGYDK